MALGAMFGLRLVGTKKEMRNLILASAILFINTTGICSAQSNDNTYLVQVSLPNSPPPQPSFFGTMEVKRGNVQPFLKWTGMLSRYAQEKSKFALCKTDGETNCPYDEWQDFIRVQRGKPLLEQLSAVNAFMNRHPYIADFMNWGIEDYWETPGEFFQQDGDCEDYAIAKFITLRRLGYESMDMRIVVVQDLNLRVAHAVLAVKSGNKTYILDNQIRQVVEDQSIHHYRPIYSLSEQAWWLHRRP